MPKHNLDFSNTFFYKIVCKDLSVTDCYVGHTTNFKARKNKHKSACGNINDKGHNLIVYQTIRVNGNWDNWEMVLIEKIDCEDSLDARKKERVFIEELKANLNMVRAYATKKEIKETAKAYRVINADKIKENAKDYKVINGDKIKEYYKSWIHKNNKEYHKEYHQKNIIAIKLRENKVYVCVCGSNYTHSNKKKHCVTQKHINYMLNEANKENEAPEAKLLNDVN